MNEGLEAGVLVGGDFRIVRPLKRGGMGAVYVAEQPSTGALRALKTMHPQLANDPKLRKRFEQEARVGARIASDHVVSVVAAGVDEKLGIPWLAMELLEGEDLGDHVGREGRLSPEDAAEVFAQLGHALTAAHAVGVVHRDLKPDNVFLARPRRAGDRFLVKVLDFGIAKLVEQAQTGLGTGTIGTPLWMSPEQTSPGAKVTSAADLWSVGLIAFHALTGVHYWRTANAAEATISALLREITLEPLDPASARASELGCAERIPPGFDDWFARCLDRDPARRFDDTAAAFAALDRVLRPGARARAERSADLSLTQTAPEAAPALPRPMPSVPQRAVTTATESTMTPAPTPPPRAGASPLTIALVLSSLLAIGVAALVVVRAGQHPPLQTIAPAAPSTTEPSASSAPSVSASSLAPPKPASLEVLALSPMKEIGGGTALIGSPPDDPSAAVNEKPAHKKMIKAFFVEITEVTVDAYARCVAAGACTPPAADPLCNASIPDRGNHPVNCVSALQAQTYCEWMGRRLPEEWEWEAAAGGLEGRRFPWGSDWPDATRACFGNCGTSKQTCAVGSFPRGDTKSGLKDLAGNVWEWTMTDYCPYTSPDCDEGDHRVIRGGGWCGGDASVLRTSARQWMSEGETKSTNVGFRCARTL